MTTWMMWRVVVVAVSGWLAVSAEAAPIAMPVAATLEIRAASQLLFTSAERLGSVAVDPVTGEVRIAARAFAFEGTIADTLSASFELSNPEVTFRPGGAQSGTCPGPIGGRGACVLGAGLGGGLGGTAPLLGTIRFPTLSVSLPASAIGGGAIASQAGIVLQGAPFTARTAAVTTTGPAAFWTTARGSVAASWYTRAGNLSMPAIQPLLLVTPVHVRLGSAGSLPVFVSLSLRAVPEPGAAILIAVGATLFWVARPRD